MAKESTKAQLEQDVLELALLVYDIYREEEEKLTTDSKKLSEEENE